MPNFLGDLTHSRYYIERPKVTKKIWNAIDRKNHILITSPRGAGKTSLLHDFCKNSKEDFKIAYVNAELINSKEEFFIRCIQAMLNCGIDRSELTLNFITDQLTPSLKTDSNLGLSIKIDKPPSNKQEIFFRALRGVNDQRKLAILMDELPQTINNMIREDGINCTIHFLQILREIRQSPDFTNIQFIFTGSTNLSEATDAFNATHLISDLIELRLPPLTEAEATHFIKQTLTDFDFSIADNQVEYLIHKIQPLFPSPINQFLRAIENIAIDEEVTQITNSEIDLAFARSINSILKPQAKIPFQKIKVTTLKIQNIKCFDDIQIDFDSSNAMELITGSNARGKTTILQLIALGLTGIKIMPFPYNWKQVIKSGAEQGQFELDILSDDKPVHLNFDIDSNDSITCTEGAEHLKSIQGKFLLLAYGANRYIKLEDPRPHPEVEAVATLFGENGYLKHIKVSANFEYVDRHFNIIQQLINAVLEKADLEKKVRLTDYDSSSLYFETSSSPRIPIEALSEGFKSTFVWLLDMIIRMVEKGGDLHNAQTITGIVLLDEVDLHLHPSWQRTILPSLNALFPNIQFIVTSHSPFVAQSIKNENLTSLEWENDQVTVVHKDMRSEMSYNAVVRDVFNIQSPFSHETALKIEQFREMQQAIRSEQTYDEDAFKQLIIEIADRGVELEGVMRREVQSLERRTGKDFNLWKK